MSAPTQADFHVVYDFCLDKARTIIAEGDGQQLAPVILACKVSQGKIRKLTIVMPEALFSTPERKDLVPAMIREIFLRKPSVNLIAMQTEAWLVMNPEDRTVAPSEHPNRKECVVLVMYARERQVFAYWPIERPILHAQDFATVWKQQYRFEGRMSLFNPEES